MGLDPSAPNGRPVTDGSEGAPAALPKIAEKADDLEAIKSAVDDAAAVGGGLWLSYLFVLFYLAVAAGAVTHADLFLENSVKLPFLNVELPLLAFFFLAPILFIVVHAYTLVHLVMLTEKAKRYHRALHNRKRKITAATRENLQWQLPSNIFIQFLAGPSDLRVGAFGWLLRAIAWVTLVIGPILLLLMMQVQFLPFHSLFITWTQRLALLVDLALIWWLWGRILSGREIDGQRHKDPPARLWEWLDLAFAVSACALLFSWTTATFPGEIQAARWPDTAVLGVSDESGELEAAPWPDRASSESGQPGQNRGVSLHDWLFNATPDETTRRRFPFSSTLVLAGFNIYESLGIDDPEKAKWHDFVFRARGRDLKGAILDFAILPKVDFERANLQGARLLGTHLQGASLEGAWLQGAFLQGAQLQGATLLGAHLQGASLAGAYLAGAMLNFAQLQGASLQIARLQGASLDNARLQGASLEMAQLQGASLEVAHLQGASLHNAQLQGASLHNAQLQGVSFERAVLEATDLSDAHLWRTNRPRPPGTLVAIRMLDEPNIPGLPPTFNADYDTPEEAERAAWLPEWIDENRELHPWGEKAYETLRTMMESLPQGDLRDEALERIESLDCANSDSTLNSCDPQRAWIPPLTPPPEAAAWRRALEKAARLDGEAYATALARTLKELVCSGDDDAIHVVRGAGFQKRLRATGRAASEVIDDLVNKDSKDCLVSASLTDADRADLRRIPLDLLRQMHAIEAGP